MLSAILPPIHVVISTAVSNENDYQFVSDDEKLDHGAPTRFFWLKGEDGQDSNNRSGKSS